MAVVYRHIRLDKNEPFYIGISNNDEKRPYSKHSRNNYWRHIVNITDYEIDILFDDLSWEDACEKEKEFIKLYGRKDLGTGTLVNMTDGGEGKVGYKHSEETLKKISDNCKGKRLGHTYTDDVIEKIRKGNQGKIVSDDTKKKQSEAKKGKSGSRRGKKFEYIKAKIIKCPHCGKEGGAPAMKQWHFNNCKKIV